ARSAGGKDPDKDQRAKYESPDVRVKSLPAHWKTAPAPASLLEAGRWRSTGSRLLRCGRAVTGGIRAAGRGIESGGIVRNLQFLRCGGTVTGGSRMAGRGIESGRILRNLQ